MINLHKKETDNRAIIISDAAKHTEQSFTVQLDIAPKHNSKASKHILNKQKSGMFCNGNAKSVTWN